MSLRRSVGFLLTRRFSPRATPRTAPARSLHSLNNFPTSDGIGRAAGLAAGALVTAATLALQYFRKDSAEDEQAARKKEEDMKAMFEDWAKTYDRTYEDEEEKAMRFQVFKDTIKWIESQSPSSQKNMLPPNCFADLKDEELPSNRSCIVDVDGPDSDHYRMRKFLAKNGKGYDYVWTPAAVEALKQATQASD